MFLQLIMIHCLLFSCFTVSGEENLCTPKVVQYCQSQGRLVTACNTERCPGITSNPAEVDAEFAQEILGLHNLIRSTPIHGISAANMRKLTWDFELEQLARISAHDICLKTVIERGCGATPNHLEAVGSSELALSADFKIDFNATLVMDKWFRKRTVQNITGSLLPFNGDKYLLPVAQILAAETKYLGCAFIQSPRKGLQLLVVCKYAPVGVAIGVNVFIVGPPGSACPAGTTANGNLCN